MRKTFVMVLIQIKLLSLRQIFNHSWVGVLRDNYFHPGYDSKKWIISIFVISEKYSGRNSLFDHFQPIFIVQNLLRPPLLGFEMRDDDIFSQSGHFHLVAST